MPTCGRSWASLFEVTSLQSERPWPPSGNMWNSVLMPQGADKHQGVFDRDAVIRLGVPDERGRGIFRDEVFERLIRFFELVLLTEKVLDGIVVGERAGRDDRI